MKRSLGHRLVHLPFLLVLAGVAAGLVATVARHPIVGCTTMAGTLMAAGVVRSGLTDAQAGLLSNRGRTFDASVLFTVGALMLVLTMSLRAVYAT